MVRHECRPVDRPTAENKFNSDVCGINDVLVVLEFRSVVVDDATKSVASVHYFQTMSEFHTIRTSLLRVVLTRMPVSLRHMKQLELRILQQIKSRVLAR